MIEIGYVSYTVSADRLAAVGADFDSASIDDAILAELNSKVGPAVEVRRDGKVFANEDSAEQARSIDWDALLRAVDIDQLIADHPSRR